MSDERPFPRFQPRRQLGRTGFTATVLGIGDLADRSVPLERCVATLHRAMDAGLNLIDTAPSYEEGYSEEIVGEALRHGRREGMFVIDKIDLLDQPVAPQVEESLRRLGLEAVDLFVFHGLSKLDAWERLAAPGGGMEQLERCVRQGKARFRGISSHHPDVLRAALESGRCDVVMFPVGPFVHPRYVEEILPLARRRAWARCASRPSAPASCSATPRATAGRSRRARAARSAPAGPRRASPRCRTSGWRSACTTRSPGPGRGAAGDELPQRAGRRARRRRILPAAHVRAARRRASARGASHGGQGRRVVEPLR